MRSQRFANGTFRHARRLWGRSTHQSTNAKSCSLVDELGVGELIEFAGFSSDVPSHLKRFDLFVMPSVGPEGLPMVLLEAMAHGLPTIGSAVAGVGDVIQPNVEGILFSAGDDDALAEAVEQFTSGRADWDAMCAAAKQRHDCEFSARRMASEFAEIYRGVVKI